MRLRIRILAIATAIGVLLASPALGQPKTPPPAPVSTSKAANPPPAGDPIVFLMFLRYHASMLQDIDKLKADGASEQSIRHSAALSFRLSDDDFASINPVYVAARKELDALDAEGIAYRDQVVGGRQVPDVKVLQQFEVRRGDIAARARATLERSLSPEGWKVLAAYIDGEFRNGIARRPLQ